jgi:energy-coupling factor transporter ATP-binding protein EcfA2
MTVQPEDIEPEDAAPAGDWRHDTAFQWPEMVPWSQLGPDFIQMWGFELPRNKREHLEVVGPSGSGKTRLVETILQDHYREAVRRQQASGAKHVETGAIFVATKTDDDIFRELGWPVVKSVDEMRGDTHVIFWPQTGKTGTARREYHDLRVGHLLDKLWQPRANTLLAFDEIGYVEGLSGNTRATVQQYWREGRALGIQVIGMKQRPQGALRDMHSETFWTVSFKPSDDADQERFAMLFGHKRDWMPVLDSLDLDRHEFLIRHSRSQDAYISWVDTPLTPQKIKRRGLAGRISGRA